MNYVATIISVLATVAIVVLIIWLSPVCVPGDEKAEDDNDWTGGTGGGAAGCFDGSTLIWTKNETQSDELAEHVMVQYLKEGDLVGTATVSMKETEKYQFMWTRATDVTISADGAWEAHSFYFLGSDHYLTVTYPHLMIIWKDGNAYFVRADQVQIGDEMKVGKTIRQVTQIKNHTIHRKVSVETEDGTVLVNSVLASGFCDHNPKTIDQVMMVEPMVQSYKSGHFGNVYNVMCMDSVSWKHSYMINNGFLIMT